MKNRICKTVAQFAVFVAALMLGAPSFAQTSIRAEAPNVVAQDEQFNVTFIIEGENTPSDFTWSPGDDFQLVWGPQKGSSTSISIVNGKRTKSSQITYTYILMPKRKGTFQIPPATATVKGSAITSRALTVEVASGGQQAQGNGGSGNASAATGEISSSDLFLRFSLSRTNVVVGEPITATLKLYQRVNIAGFEDAKFPNFNGFWSQEVQTPTNIEFRRETVGDQIYNAAVLRSWVIIPQQSGDIPISPAELVCLVNIRSATTTGSIFDSFFQDDYRTVRKRVSSQEYTVHVSPLPSGAPSSFGGGVGRFDISSKITRDSLKTHEAASLVITLTGQGNVSLLEAPKVNFPPDFEVYDVKVTDRTDKATGKTTGSKSFEYPFIPRSNGDFVIDPVDYSYYDVNSRKYITLRTSAVSLSVARGAQAEPSSSLSVTGALPSGVTHKDVRNLGSDIRYIVTRTPSFGTGTGMFVFSQGFWALLVFILVAGTVLYFAFRKAAARRADVAGTKNRKAAAMAKRKLNLAGEYLKQNLYSAFYEELHKALLGFAGDKLGLDLADMSKENISEKLVAAGVSDAVSAEFIALLDECEYARYAPGAGSGTMDGHYGRALGVITSIDSSMKNNRKPATGTAAAIVAALMLIPSQYASARVDQTAADSLWNVACSAYADGRWDDAEAGWKSLKEMGVVSAELDYNIGNACFKKGDYSHAILNYERALKLNPSFSDARFNLDYCGEFVQDRIEVVPEFFLKTWSRRLCWMLPSDIWAALLLFFFASAVALALLFLLAPRAGARKTGFYSGIASLVLAFACLLFARWQWVDSRATDAAIIVRAVSSVKSAPGVGSGKDLFILHEGTKVKILDTVGEWVDISLADGRQGWMLISDIEII